MDKAFTAMSNKLYGIQGIDFSKRNISADIHHNNINILKVASAMMSLIFLIMFALSFFIPNYQSNRMFYGFETFANLAVMTSSVFLLHKKVKFTLAFVYIFDMLLHYYGIYVGVINQQTNLAVTSCLFLAVLPLLFVDDVLNIIVFTTSAAIINAISMIIMKTEPVLTVDLTDVLFSWLMGVALGIEVNRIKIKSYIREYDIVLERDTDGLTGLWNKNTIVKKVSELVCDQKAAGAFFIMDIDHFKQINDTCGHKFGDEVLKSASVCIQDIFGNDDITGRFGGDEFIFYKKGADYPSAAETAEKLIKKLYGSISIPTENKGIQVSIGIAVYKGTPGTDYDQLMIMADKALYVTKKNGRFGYTFFSTEKMEKLSVTI